MGSLVAALVVPSVGAPLVHSRIERRDPASRELVIAISHVGICHSDVHQAGGEWGEALFPMVPGHEIVGTVVEAAADVAGFRVGDRVGVGCYVDSCRECRYCARGEQQHCSRGETATYNSIDVAGRPTFGGYSQRITVDERYVLRIPEGMDPASTAPLLCAGITVFQPLAHWRVGHGTRVAVVGLGGLGHVAVQIAAELGARVTVLSRSDAKRADAIRFGAAELVPLADAIASPAMRAGFDLVLNTMSAHTDLDGLLQLLDLDGTLVELGIPPEPERFDAVALGAMRRSIAATKNGGIPQTQEMLEFCAQHGIAADVEVIGADAVNDAYAKVRAGSGAYRYVIDCATLASS